MAALTGHFAFRRRFRSLRGARDRYGLGLSMIEVALRDDDPLLAAALRFLSGRRDLLTAAEARAFRVAVDREPPGAARELAAAVAAVGGDVDVRQMRATRDRLTAPGTTSGGDAVVWRLRRGDPHDPIRRQRDLGALWRAVAPERSRALRREFARWLARQADVRGTCRDLAALVPTALPVTSPIRLSVGGPALAAWTPSPPAADPDPDRTLAAWLGLVFAGGAVAEDPDEDAWWTASDRRVVAVDGPLVPVGAVQAAALERYVAAVLLARADRAAEALLSLCDEPSVERGRRIRDAARRMVPDGDRLEGDWSDRPEATILAHWRMVSEAGLQPGRALLAFWRGLAAWEARPDGPFDLRAAFQRWQAARIAAALAAERGASAIGTLGIRAAETLDERALGRQVGPTPTSGASRLLSGAGVFLAGTAGLGWLRPDDLPAVGVLALVALAAAWALRADTVS